MLDLDLIDNLYASLPKDKQQELITLLFKKSKQTMTYFRRTKDISLTKLEILADFFRMPLDYFRKEKTGGTNVAGINSDIRVGNITMSTSLMLENESLQKQLKAAKTEVEKVERNMEDLRANIETYKDFIKAKDVVILSLQAQLQQGK